MKKALFSIHTLYIVSTLIIVVLVGLIGGVVDILQTQNVIDAASSLGYPLYFFTLLGVFKILGAVALLLPNSFEKIRLLAYFGFAVDFIFASFSHYSINDTMVNILVPLIFLTILSISYFLAFTNSFYKSKVTSKE